MPAAAAAAAAAGSSSHAASAPPPDENHSAARKLTDEEVKACADRLSHPITRNVEPLPPLVPKKTLTKEQLDGSVQKLYTQSITRKKQLLEEIKQKEERKDATAVKALPSLELDSTFDRLYTQQMEMKRKNELKQKEVAAAEHAKQKKFHNRDEQLESAKRLCDASIEKAREAHRGLFERYVTATEPHYKKMSKEELAASAARLTRKE